MSDVRVWMDNHTTLFLQALDALSDSALDDASALPGWSRRHLVAHVHYNAEALRRLVRWAATGEKTPMYASPEQRRAEIDSGAALAPVDLRWMVAGSAEALANDLDALDAAAWRAEVVTAQGRTIAAAEIPWLRTREVCLHTIDLDCGARFADIEPGLTDALLTDVVARRVSQGHGATLTGWLTGRTATPPQLGPWL